MSPYRPVTAALRVMQVLAAVNRAPGKATVGEVHRLTGLDKATIVRMFTTLVHAGYIVRDEEQAVYRVTGKTLELSAGYDRLAAISAIVADDLTAFRQSIGWPSDVAILDRDAMIVVETSRTAEPMQFRRAPGFRAPVLSTSIGLSYLANCPKAERDTFIARAASDMSPQFDLARKPEELAAKLEAVRAQGYATMDETYSRENYDSQFFSIGVPIMSGAQVFGAVNIIYLRAAMSTQDARATLLNPLRDVAARMAAKLAQKTSLGS